MTRKIIILSTGGTIAMGYDAERRGLTPLSDGVGELLRGLPDHGYPVEAVEFSNVPSAHMTPARMRDLADESDRLLAMPDVVGMVITHGTDTMEESAFFLDLCLESEKPVCFTAAMRSREDPGFDGTANIMDAVRAAASEETSGQGVTVVMNNEIHAARFVTKTHTGNVAAFASPFWGPLGYVDSDRVIIRRQQLHRARTSSRKMAENVPILKMYTGMDDSMLSFLLDRGLDGLIVEGFGRGNVPPSALPGLMAILKKGIPVVLCSRVWGGRTLDVYGAEGGGAHLKEAGVIFSGELTAPKARLQLMLALGVTRDPEHLHFIFE